MCFQEAEFRRASNDERGFDTILEVLKAQALKDAIVNAEPERATFKRYAQDTYADFVNRE